MDHFVDLDVIGALESADKSSSFLLSWDYLRHYEAVFEKYRNAPITILEIGIFQGASLRLWKWYFPNARIVGIDINDACRSYQDDRVIVEIGSQTDPAFLADIATRYVPTIIIDDGSHVDEHMIFTFEQLLPKLTEGGIYIIEDIVHRPLQEEKKGGGNAHPKASAYFLEIGASCLAGGDRPAAPPCQISSCRWSIAPRFSKVRCASANVTRNAMSIARS